MKDYISQNKILHKRDNFKSSIRKSWILLQHSSVQAQNQNFLSHLWKYGSLKKIICLSPVGRNSF